MVAKLQLHKVCGFPELKPGFGSEEMSLVNLSAPSKRFFKEVVSRLTLNENSL